MNLLLLLFWTSAFTAYGNLSFNQSAYSKAFVQQYLAPKEISDYLDSKYDHRNKKWKLQKLDHKGQSAGEIFAFEVAEKKYLLKTGLHRIIEREHLMGLIQKFGLDRIRIPKKWLYSLPKTQSRFHDNSLRVVVEWIEGEPVLFQKEDAETIIQLLTLCMAGLWSDPHPGNLLKMNQLLYLIDTEPDVHTLAEKSERIHHKVIDKLDSKKRIEIIDYFQGSFFAQHFKFLQK